MTEQKIFLSTNELFSTLDAAFKHFRIRTGRAPAIELMDWPAEGYGDFVPPVVPAGHKVSDPRVRVAAAGGAWTWAVEAKSAEELREEFKVDRQAIVDAIKVTTEAGHVFDGDEISQTRMARAVAAMDEGETITWVLADNSVITAGRAELREALRLAGRAQEAAWVP